MLKYIAFILYLNVSLSAKDIIVAIPENILSSTKHIFSGQIDYTNLKTKLIKTESTKEALDMIASKKANFAVIRSDILWYIQQDKYPYSNIKDKYILISKLPVKSKLYLTRYNILNDIQLKELLGKRVGVGKLGEMGAEILKNILKPYGDSYKILYKSYTYFDSLDLMRKNYIDAFFGFIPEDTKRVSFYYQDIFSNNTLKYFEGLKPYLIDHEGISVSYTIIASINTSDEHIENIIYRLYKKDLFEPELDKQYGKINLYVNHHIEQIGKVINERNIKNRQIATIESHQSDYISQECMSYHYGFLDLLRRKPPLKKILRRVSGAKYSKIKQHLYQIDSILINIDKSRNSCDHTILSKYRKKFFFVEGKIKALLK